MKTVWLSVFLLVSHPIAADEKDLLSNEHSAFFGVARKQQYLPDVVMDCPENSVCMDGYYVWTLHVQKHISGPEVPQVLRAAMLQHGKYIDADKQRSIYIVARIVDPEKRRLFGADYYIEEYAPPDTVYCLSDKVVDYGLATSTQIRPTLALGCYSQ